MHSYFILHFSLTETNVALSSLSIFVVVIAQVKVKSEELYEFFSVGNIYFSNIYTFYILATTTVFSGSKADSYSALCKASSFGRSTGET